MKRLLFFGMFLVAAQIPVDAKGRPHPGISMAKARATALARVPGTVKSAELEEEKGVLLYSFDIRDNTGQIMEVQVDAKSGKIISAEQESAEKERAEEAAEKGGERAR